MAETLTTRSATAVSSFDRDHQGRRSLRGARAHPLVASLAGGLQATYATQSEDEVMDRFASLIARLDRCEPDAH
jgi:hypothetical protein